MRLADTSFWVALAARRDGHHLEARALSMAQPEPVMVSNHIAGETWTFLRRRAGHAIALQALSVFSSRRVNLVHVEERDEREAWGWFRRHDEREYSFVDATRFVLMRRHRVQEALAFDGDFVAAGFIELRP